MRTGASPGYSRAAVPVWQIWVAETRTEVTGVGGSMIINGREQKRIFMNICFLKVSFPWLCRERRLWGVFPLSLWESDGGNRKGERGCL